MKKSGQRTDYGYSRTVSYTASHHVSVICQLYGSVWIKVLPYCLVNVAIFAFLVYLLKAHNIDLTISQWGHEFMAVLASFLVISKVTLTIGVYYEFQDSLMQMNQAVRDLVQMACAFTEHHKSSSSNSLQAWRFDVANHALLLQMTTTTMLHKTNNMNAWETAGMTESEQFRLKLFLDDDDTHDSYTSLEDDHAQHSRGWAHGYHLDSDLNLRVPIRMAHRLRSVIALHRKFHDPSLHVHTMQEQQLLAPLATF